LSLYASVKVFLIVISSITGNVRCLHQNWSSRRQWENNMSLLGQELSMIIKIIKDGEFIRNYFRQLLSLDVWYHFVSNPEVLPQSWIPHINTVSSKTSKSFFFT
jgi:hypothetical protein